MKADVYMGATHIGTADINVHLLPIPLPKPSRVEKWQLWRNEMGDVEVYGLEGFVSGEWVRFSNGYGLTRTAELLTCAEWTFLGYAKPDKVEVGQRWRNQGREYVVGSIGDGIANLGGATRASCESMLKYDTFEYLGMANSDNRPTIPGAKTVIVGPAKNVGHVTLSDDERRFLGEMLLEWSLQSEEPLSDALQAIRAKARLPGTLDLGPTECAAMMAELVASDVGHYKRAAVLIGKLDEGARR